MIKKLSNKNGKDLNETPKSRFREKDYKLLPLPIGSERRRRKKKASHGLISGAVGIDPGVNRQSRMEPH